MRKFIRGWQAQKLGTKIGGLGICCTKKGTHRTIVRLREYPATVTDRGITGNGSWFLVRSRLAASKQPRQVAFASLRVLYPFP